MAYPFLAVQLGLNYPQLNPIVCGGFTSSEQGTNTISCFYVDTEHLIRKLPVFWGDCCLSFCDQEYAHTLGEEVVQEIFECS